jgi:peptidoglycan/xylan/chitin deacetylase (PgdA/CDA1 family)
MLRLILLAASVLPVADAQAVKFIGKAKYLNNARAVVVHSIDDSTKYVPDSIDVMDRYGIKATIFVSTEHDPAPEDRFFTQLQVSGLWPRLRKAVENGHEIGSHSRQHSCKKPDNETFCDAAFSEYEVSGSRDDILRLTQQPYVWSWCYPCGNCADYPFIQKRIAAAGYIVARNYPNELQNGHVKPGIETWDSNPMNAGYTQVVQHRNAAKSDAVDLAALNATFDDVYKRGAIYHFMSHPQWLDYGPEAFYERHMKHVGGRSDVWYVPMGPLYAYRTISESSTVKPLPAGSHKARFSVSNVLNPKIYSGSISLEFSAPSNVAVLSNGQILPEGKSASADRWDGEYYRRDGDRVIVTVRSNTTLEFR